MTTYRVTATREGDWWSLVAHDVQGREVASQSRRLDQADAAIREAIALVLDVDGDEFEVAISPDLRHVEVSDDTLEAHELRRALTELSNRARRRTPAAVAELRAAGLTVRDVAQLLGITPSWVSQIEKQDRLANSAQHPGDEPVWTRGGVQHTSVVLPEGAVASGEVRSAVGERRRPALVAERCVSSASTSAAALVPPWSSATPAVGSWRR